MKQLPLRNPKGNAHTTPAARRPWLAQAIPLLMPLILGALLATGCANQEAQKSQLAELNAPQSIQAALAAIDNNEPDIAILALQGFSSRLAFSELLPQSYLLGALAYYQSGEYELARAQAQSMVELFPRHPLASTAHYLIAQSYFAQIRSPSHDQANALAAKNAFTRLTELFPNSDAARLAGFKLDAIEDLLAAKEMYVGRWYLRQQRYGAAINRFLVVLNDYETTSQVQEAMMRLAESYLALGLVDQAVAYAALLGTNYPASAWYYEAYNLLSPHVAAQARRR